MSDFLGLTLFTLVEDAALVVWLMLVRTSRQIGGIATLIVGFFIEHVIAYNVKRRASLFSLQSLPAGKVFLNALLETFFVWAIWLVLWGIHPALAIVYVYPTLIVEHSFTDNIFKQRPLFSNLFNKKVWGFSFLEGTGCNGWLALVTYGQPVAGVVVLVVFQFLEHRMAINLGRQPAPVAP